MGLLNRDGSGQGISDGLQRHFEAQVSRLTAGIDNLLANSVGIDDHARIDSALAGI